MVPRRVPLADPVVGAAGRGSRAEAVVARSALVASHSLGLEVAGGVCDLAGRHVALPDGAVAVAVGALTAAGGRLVGARGREGAVTVHVTDVLPVAVRSRVRAVVSLRGTCRPLDPARLDGYDTDTVLSLTHLPADALWVVDPTEVVVLRDGATARLTGEEYRAARPDPLARLETRHMLHLASRHPDALVRLAAVADELRPPDSRVVPVALDCRGITLRSEGAAGHRDVRLPFRAPVVEATGLSRELRALLARAGMHPAPADGRPPA